MIAVAETLERTCFACPSQWEGSLSDGRMFYIRYRHGTFALRFSQEQTSDVHDAIIAPETMLMEPDDIESDGFMTDDEMMLLTQEHIDWGVIKDIDHAKT